MVTTPEKSCVKPKANRLKGVCIGNHPADDISGAVSVQIGEGKHLNMADSFCADVLYGTVGHAVIDEVHDPGRGAGESGQYENLP